MRNNRNSSRNVGIELGRIVCTFLVVCNHFFSGGIGEKWIIPMRQLAVPYFLIVSFYYCDSKNATDWSNLSTRLSRILAPFYFWGLAFIPRILPDSPKNMATHILSQLSFGNSYNAPLWFLFVLAELTVLWAIAQKCGVFKRHPLFILLTFLVFSEFLQYSGLNYAIFKPFPSGIGIPLGRLVECTPFAIVGILMSRLRIADCCGNSRFRVMFLIVSAILCIPFSEGISKNGFGYQGLTLLRCGTFMSVAFFLMPLNSRPKPIIMLLAKYSLGVYCIHVPVGALFTSVLMRHSIQMDRFYRCCLIYMVSWCLSCALAVFFPRFRKFVQ